ncbi:MAG TPA: hypothetical protein VK183_03860, partial [Flavobacterium sp.]|nr:hypothetical protein [Flavobacterium sp.]
MKIAERILLGITALGIVLRIAHIPGGAILSIMMIAILSLFYAGLGYFLFAPPQHEFTLNGMMFRKQKPIDIALSA